MTTPLAPLPPAFSATRDILQRVATHILARRRHALSGKFGLRAAPGGIASPAAGLEHETLRISGTRLIRESTGLGALTTSLVLDGATLAEAAALIGVDLSEPFVAGHDTPPVGDPTAPLAIDAAAAEALAAWFAFAWRVLDAAVAGLGEAAEPSVVQLWPEHFDAAIDVAASPGRRVNLGASPGDGYNAEPYLYVGPWDAERPGDAEYWNAPFGAVLSYSQLAAADDPTAAAVAFLSRGVELLSTVPVADAAE